jgi:hypothetical protein
MYYIPGVPLENQPNNFFQMNSFKAKGGYKNLINNSIIVILVVILVVYIYYKNIHKVIYDKLFSNSKIITKKSKIKNKITVITPQVDELENSSKYNDDPDWNYDENCEEVNCPDLACPDGSMGLREKNKCCPKCVFLDDGYDSESIYEKQEKKLKELNKFIEKNEKPEINFDINNISINTTNVTFSIIDRLLDFDYLNFNLSEFIHIFTREEEYLYVGIIFIVLGLLFTFLDLTDLIDFSKSNSNNINGNVTLPTK